jgi:hypothetical protein
VRESFVTQNVPSSKEYTLLWNSLDFPEYCNLLISVIVLQ